MKTLFISQSTGLLKEINEIMILKRDDIVHLNGKIFKVLSDSMIDLDNDQIVNYIWQNPYSDK